MSSRHWRQAKGDEKFQFERHGYFVADWKDHGEGKPVFNRVTGMKDSWGKQRTISVSQPFNDQSAIHICRIITIGRCHRYHQ